jgi:hypothetical protein
MPQSFHKEVHIAMILPEVDQICWRWIDFLVGVKMTEWEIGADMHLDPR